MRVIPVGLALLFACARPVAQMPDPAASGPVITRLDPVSGPAGVAYPIRLTIEGRGFADTANVVTFAGIVLRGLPSTDGGTRIVFYVPKSSPSSGEAPPTVLEPGVYDVIVTTHAGASPPVHFTLTRPGGRE